MGFAIETLGIHFQDQKYSIENIQTIEIDGHRDIIDGHRWIIDPNHTDTHWYKTGLPIILWLDMTKNNPFSMHLGDTIRVYERNTDIISST
jgi:hypothetical protein